MENNKLSFGITGMVSATIIIVCLIATRCSVQTAEIDGKQGASCVQSGGAWVKAPKATEYSCYPKKGGL